MNRINVNLKIHILFFIFSISGIFSKFASQTEFLSKSYMTNMFIVLVIFGFYALFWQKIIATVPISNAYAHRSILIIWGFIWGLLIFSETIDVKMVIGGALILIGLWRIGKS